MNAELESKPLQEQGVTFKRMKNEETNDIKPGSAEVKQEPLSSLNSMSRTHWQPGSWQDGTRRSAFQPYRPTMVLTNLQRGNIPTETLASEQADMSLHHRAGQGEITEQDLKLEQDVDVTDSNGLSALMWASAYGQLPTVQLLLQHGAQVDLVGQEGETPLLLAAAGGHQDVVKLLLSEGANVNHADDVGNTALMYAAHGDHPHSSNELLLRGADLTMVNLNSDTAFGIAVNRKSKLGESLPSSVAHRNDGWTSGKHLRKRILLLFNPWPRMRAKVLETNITFHDNRQVIEDGEDSLRNQSHYILKVSEALECMRQHIG